MRSGQGHRKVWTQRVGLGLLTGVALLPATGGVALATNCPPSPSTSEHATPTGPSLPGLPGIGLPEMPGLPGPGTPNPGTPSQPSEPIADVPCAAAVTAQSEVDAAQARLNSINAEKAEVGVPLSAAQNQVTNDGTIYRAYERQQAESQVELSRANDALASAQAGGDAEQIAAAQTRVEQAQAELDRNTAGLERATGPAQQSWARVAELQPRYDELEQAAWSAQRYVYAAQDRARAVVCETPAP